MDLFSSSFETGRKVIKMNELIICNGYRYYYTKLNDSEKQVYDALVKCVAGLKKKTVIKPSSIETVQKVFDYIEWDFPEFFFVKSILMGAKIGKVYEVTYDYSCNYEQAKSTLEEVDRRIQMLVGNCRNFSDYEKARKIHDYLIENCEYDKNGNQYTYEITGPVLHGRSVCEGFSKAFKYIADRVGLKAICVNGDVVDESEQHAWNKVWMGNTLTNIDVTFDLSMTDKKSNHIRYDYFGLGDKEMIDRVEESGSLLGEGGCGYYISEKLYASGKSELVKIIREKLEPGKWLTFKVPMMNVSQKEMMDVVKDIVANNIPNKYKIFGYNIEFTSNLKVNVFSVRVCFN